MSAEAAASSRRHRLLFLCPDIAQPTGGVRVLYRHVDILNGAGHDALVVHQQPGFRCTWFDNATRVTDQSQIRPEPARDVFVVPEILAPSAMAIAPGLPKVIFNQNAYYTFNGLPADRPGTDTPYRHPDARATIVVSEDSERYLRYAFPGHDVRRVLISVDTDLFTPHPDKGWRLAYMPRKNPQDSQQVINLLRARGALEGLEVVALDGLPQAEVARALGQTLIFLSFGHPEGFGLPAAEAMAAGCLTVGYHGRGGAEFLRDPYAYPIPLGNVVEFARTVEDLIARLRADPGDLLEQAESASAFIAETYSSERERRSVTACWRDLLATL